MDTGVFPSCAAGVPIFQVLGSEDLAALAQAMHHRRVAKGECVLTHGMPVEHLVVVARGRLNVVHTSASGREQVVRVLGPGEFIGEMALFTPTLATGDLIAAEETTVCLISRQTVQQLMQNRPAMALRLVQALAERLEAAERRVADLGLRDVGQRLAAELYRLSAEGDRGPEGVTVRVPVPWAELATRLGTTPESLSRRLKALAADGLIHQLDPRTVVIPEPERLREVAEG